MGAICKPKEREEVETKPREMQKKVVIVGSAAVGKTTIIEDSFVLKMRFWEINLQSPLFVEFFDRDPFPGQ